ncbi:hypothetical protein CDAR_128071 [Caerostris darwini]|uniref:Secreted protein n=1 Tax=Caerostris darwini TaxID=1538125 RepID=A0AAV4P5J9_9ARAC|nr:hypothetical protein CDAR_128071 [Caerostris darwini]
MPFKQKFLFVSITHLFLLTHLFSQRRFNLISTSPSSPAICMCVHKTPFHYITIYQFNSFTSRKQPISDEKPIVTFDYRTAGTNPLSTGTRSSLIFGEKLQPIEGWQMQHNWRSIQS